MADVFSKSFEELLAEAGVAVTDTTATESGVESAPVASNPLDTPANPLDTPTNPLDTPTEEPVKEVVNKADQYLVDGDTFGAGTAAPAEAPVVDEAKVAADKAKAEADKVAADKAKAEADKVAADKAKAEADKVAADKAKADKVAADKVAADKAKVEEKPKATKRSPRKKASDDVITVEVGINPKVTALLDAKELDAIKKDAEAFLNDAIEVAAKEAFSKLW